MKRDVWWHVNMVLTTLLLNCFSIIGSAAEEDAVPDQPISARSEIPPEMLVAKQRLLEALLSPEQQAAYEADRDPREVFLEQVQKLQTAPPPSRRPSTEPPE